MTKRTLSELPSNSQSQAPRDFKQKLIRAAGTILILIALGFVLHKLVGNWQVLSGWRPGATGVFYFGLLAILYGLSSILMVLAWHKLIVFFGQTVSFATNFKIFARTQIGKYIPGNIFHIAGRHTAGKLAGCSHGALAGAAFYEILGVLFAASTLAIIGLVFWRIEVTAANIGLLVLIIVTTGLLPLFLYLGAAKMKRLQLEQKTFPDILSSLSVVYLLYFINFLVRGTVFFLVVSAVSGNSDYLIFGPAVTIYALSWLVGYITPGASGGLGVREAIIIGLLSSSVGEPVSVLTALLFRVVTILGEGVFFGLSFLPSLVKKG